MIVIVEFYVLCTWAYVKEMTERNKKENEIENGSKVLRIK
jgi:hypothetical protein